MPTVYITLPNTGTGSIDLVQALASYPGINCLTASVANYCYGFATGSYATFFNGNVSGSYGNVAVSASAQKDDCTGPACFTASFYTTIVPANTYFSTASQADANNQAIAYLTSVSQSNANTFGSCSYNVKYSTEISASVQKNDCPICQTGSTVLVILPASHSQTFCDQVDAQTDAQIYFNANSQSWANTSGSCIINYYYNTATSSLVQRNNCGPCATGSFVTYSLAASQSQFTSTCSYAEAQSNFIAYFNSTSQSYANTNATCSFTAYYSTAISASVYKNNCTGGFSTGSYETVTLAASYSMNTCSVADANIVAQAYFNANSQSWANASGSCSPTASYFPTLYVNSNDDVLDTWNFPLTYSVISTGSYYQGQVIGPPENNDPRWLPFGYRSASQNTGSAGTSIYYPLTVPTYYGSNCWVKVRDKFGNNIPYTYAIGNTTKFMFRVDTQGGSTYAENPSIPHLSNNLTQSLGTGSNIYFEIINDGVTNWPGLPVTASYIYTQSANFPTLGDAKWKPYAYWVSNSVGGADWRAPNIKIAGVTQSIYDVKAKTGYYVSQSGYYYFKLQTPNNFLITGSMNIENNYGYASSSYVYSGSMLQLQVFNLTQSDNNQVNIKVGPII